MFTQIWYEDARPRRRTKNVDGVWMHAESEVQGDAATTAGTRTEETVRRMAGKVERGKRARRVAVEKARAREARTEAGTGGGMVAGMEAGAEDGENAEFHAAQYRPPSTVIKEVVPTRRVFLIKAAVVAPLGR